MRGEWGSLLPAVFARWAIGAVHCVSFAGRRALACGADGRCAGAEVAV